MSVVRLTAKLDRTDGGTSWGFRMAGGRDYGTPLTLQKVMPGSLAARCGLQEGDTIIKIGGVGADHLRHKEAQQRIIDSGNSLELALERAGGSSVGGPSSYDNFSASPAPYKPISAPKPFASNNVGSPSTSDQYSVPWARGPSSPTAPASNVGGSSSPFSGSGGGFGGSGGGGGGAWRPPVPTGPRQMRVGRAGEARTLTSMVGARVPMCSACGTTIRGPFISALDKTWCPDHFMCANPNCRQPLISCGFVEEQGQLYCERDYEQFLAPKCGKCGRSIVGEVVNAMKNTFHMGCFVCVQCHQPIGTGSFHNEDGKIYCQKDWGQMFQTKCYGCQFPIEPGDRWVEALQQNWHSECFNCSTCQVNLEGQGFVAKNGKPYCKRHGAGGRF